MSARVRRRVSCSVDSGVLAFVEENGEEEGDEGECGGHGLSHVGIQADGGDRKGDTREWRNEVRDTGGVGERRIEVRRRGRSRFDDTYDYQLYPVLFYFEGQMTWRVDLAIVCSWFEVVYSPHRSISLERVRTLPLTAFGIHPHVTVFAHLDSGFAFLGLYNMSLTPELHYSPKRERLDGNLRPDEDAEGVGSGLTVF